MAVIQHGSYRGSLMNYVRELMSKGYSVDLNEFGLIAHGLDSLPFLWLIDSLLEDSREAWLI